MNEKVVCVSYSRPDNSWVVRFWSVHDQVWKEDSRYVAEDVDDDNGGCYSLVNDNILCDLATYCDLGYKVEIVL